MDTRENEIKRLEKRRTELEAELRQLESAAVCNWARHEHVARKYAAILTQLHYARTAWNMQRQEGAG